MFKIVPLTKTILSPGAVCRLTLFGLALSVQCSAFAAGADPAGAPSHSNPGYDTIHSIQVNRSQTSKKHKIKLYPDARQQVLFFSATGDEGKVYQLYLFDMDGRLLSREEWDTRKGEWLPTAADREFVATLQKPVYEAGKIANWIAPPPRGIKGLPFEYEYVRLA